MKNKYIRLKALLLAGTMFLSSSILTSCKEDTSNQTVISEEITTNFDIGEHIISIPISKDIDIRNCNVQYDYHPGYEPIGISSSAYGKFDNNFGGGVILYKNIVPVQCYLEDDSYTTFGQPIQKEKVKVLN